MSKHSPSPWSVFDGRGNQKLIVNEATTIAQTMCGNDKANARLIAAAPMLLEIVTALLSAIEGENITNTTDEDTTGVLADFARDAIAAATGETP